MMRRTAAALVATALAAGASLTMAQPAATSPGDSDDECLVLAANAYQYSRGRDGTLHRQFTLHAGSTFRMHDVRIIRYRGARRVLMFGHGSEHRRLDGYVRPKAGLVARRC